MANPTLLSRLLCADADKNTIPDTDAGTAGIFSQQYGWQAINSLPLSAGGKAVQRQDFNGVFNLLGGIAFYAQKGYTWQWDSSQDYFVGCIVIDPNDGKRYECISDVTANATSPNADTTHWTEFKSGLEADQIPAVNKRDVITTSGTYTAPVTGWYKITAKGGGGGGGGGGTVQSSQLMGGSGGGEGGTTIAYAQMTAGDTATVVIGAGGSGGARNTDGTDGGDTSVTFDGNTYTAKGGKKGTANSLQNGNDGGEGTINGCSGGTGCFVYTDQGYSAPGGNGGGAGGGTSSYYSATDGTQGGGGGGGAGRYSAPDGAGGNGGNGYVWFEYFATI